MAAIRAVGAADNGDILYRDGICNRTGRASRADFCNLVKNDAWLAGDQAAYRDWSELELEELHRADH